MDEAVLKMCRFDAVHFMPSGRSLQEFLLGDRPDITVPVDWA